MSERGKNCSRGWDYVVAWLGVAMAGGMPLALAVGLPWHAMIIAIAGGIAITVVFLFRFLSPSWRPSRTRPFSHLLAFATLVVVPSSLTSIRPGISFAYALLALGVWVAVHGIREAFSAEEHGFLSPDTFARIVTGGALLIMGEHLATASLLNCGLLPWVQTALDVTPVGRLYSHLPDFIAAAVFPIALTLAINTPGLRVRLAWLLCAGALALGIFLSYGRSAILVIIVELFALAVIMRSRRRVILVAGGLLIATAIGALFLPGVAERLLTILHYGQGTAGFRIEVWRATLVLIGHAPFLGYGLGTFPDLASTIPGIGEAARISCPHNFYLHLAVECGVPALLVFTGGCAVVLGRVFQAFEPAAIGDGNTRNGLRLALLMLAAGLMVYGLFDT